MKGNRRSSHFNKYSNFVIISSLISLIIISNCILLFHNRNKSSFLYSNSQNIQNNKKYQGIILTCYFSSKDDPQRYKQIDNDNYNYIKPLYESVLSLQLKLIIFHDSLSESFINTYSNEYITFIHVSLRDSISMNDERFLFYQNYLRYNNISDNYEYVILSDISDVIIYKNPFIEFVKQINNENNYKLWILQEDTKLSDMMTVLKNCYSSRSNFIYKSFNLYNKVYNAGVIGGSVYNMQIFIDSLVQELTRIDKGRHNCNMPALQYIITTYNITQISSNGICWKNDYCDINTRFIHHKPPELYE